MIPVHSLQVTPLPPPSFYLPSPDPRYHGAKTSYDFALSGFPTHGIQEHNKVTVLCPKAVGWIFEQQE